MTAAIDFSWNHSAQIAPIFSAFWTASGFMGPYQFYGTDRAIAFLIGGWRMAYDQAKPLFANKRDFIVNTILGLPEFFCRHAAVVFMQHPSIDAGREWFGTGGY